jgi:hypothetical protein
MRARGLRSPWAGTVVMIDLRLPTGPLTTSTTRLPPLPPLPARKVVPIPKQQDVRARRRREGLVGPGNLRAQLLGTVAVSSLGALAATALAIRSVDYITPAVVSLAVTRKRFSALPRTSCTLNRVVTLLIDNESYKYVLMDPGRRSAGPRTLSAWTLSFLATRSPR